MQRRCRTAWPLPHSHTHCIACGSIIRSLATFTINKYAHCNMSVKKTFLEKFLCVCVCWHFISYWNSYACSSRRSELMQATGSLKWQHFLLWNNFLLHEVENLRKCCNVERRLHDRMPKGVYERRRKLM